MRRWWRRRQRQRRLSECTPGALFATLSRSLSTSVALDRGKSEPRTNAPLPPTSIQRFVFWIIFILDPPALACFSPFSVIHKCMTDSTYHTPPLPGECVYVHDSYHPPSECMHTFQQCCSRVVYLCVADKHYVQRSLSHHVYIFS